jgi:uncharacterized NAD-dependent epimerase/dehydratase family protein
MENPHTTPTHSYTPEGYAIVYCQGAFNTPNGKTAHGLVRFTERYDVLSVVDERHAGQDAGEVLDYRRRDIPVIATIQQAMQVAREAGTPAKFLVVGLAPDGGRLPDGARKDILFALEQGLDVDSGLHDFISEDPVFIQAAQASGARIRDIRKTPSRSELHFFNGSIESVKCLKLAVLGTDSALGKRTTAWILVHALQKAGYKAEMIGTGQTAWMQGARYGLVMDSLINDFVSGEIEHAVYQAWIEKQPDVVVIEGQGSLMNPAYPGGFEILAAGRPDAVILQHAPARLEYDGFPGYPIQPLPVQIQAIEILSNKPVVAVTINHEELTYDQIQPACQAIQDQTGLPAFDVLANGATELLAVIEPLIAQNKKA